MYPPESTICEGRKPRGASTHRVCGVLCCVPSFFFCAPFHPSLLPPAILIPTRPRPLLLILPLPVVVLLLLGVVGVVVVLVPWDLVCSRPLAFSCHAPVLVLLLLLLLGDSLCTLVHLGLLRLLRCFNFRVRRPCVVGAAARNHISLHVDSEALLPALPAPQEDQLRRKERNPRRSLNDCMPHFERSFQPNQPQTRRESRRKIDCA